MTLKILNLYAGIGGNRKLWTGDIVVTAIEWDSPPCPTHSRIRQFSAVGRGQNDAVYPDMQLYQEIIFLMFNFEGKWVVENVCSYYEPLIKPQELASHYFWDNFPLGNRKIESRGHNATMEVRQEIKGFDLTNYNDIDKQKILRNCVEPETGLHIFNMAYKEKQHTLMG